jgi:hypothetical protein
MRVGLMPGKWQNWRANLILGCALGLQTTLLAAIQRATATCLGTGKRRAKAEQVKALRSGAGKVVTLSEGR